MSAESINKARFRSHSSSFLSARKCIEASTAEMMDNSCLKIEEEEEAITSRPAVELLLDWSCQGISSKCSQLQI